jgi:hypothetical protein
MKTLITGLAVRAILTASAVAKTQRTKGVRRNAVIRTRVTQINSYCRFVHGETDPGRRVRFQLARDCKWYQEE